MVVFGIYAKAGGPNNVSCTNGQHTEGVSIHNFPNANKDTERYGVWVKFVRKHRPGWNPSQTSVLCGSHFEDSCFEQNRAIAASLGMKTRLKRDAVPTLDNANQRMLVEKSPLDRERRKVIIIYCGTKFMHHWRESQYAKYFYDLKDCILYCFVELYCRLCVPCFRMKEIRLKACL